jgi:hypothetical protein
VSGRDELVVVGVEQVDGARVDIEDTGRVVDDMLGNLLVGFGVQELPGRLLEGRQRLLALFPFGDVRQL